METLKQEALSNLRDFIKSTPKSVLLERLNALSKVNKGGVRISEILNGCFDQEVPYYYFSESEVVESVVSESFNVKNEHKTSIIVGSQPPNYSYTKTNNKNPHKNAGFFIMFASWINYKIQ